MFLPSEYKITRKIYSSCHDDSLYNFISNIDNLDKWFYISKSLDSTLKYKFNYDTINHRSSVEWNGDLMGQGVFRFTEKNKNREIKFKISFQNDAVHKSGKILLIPKANGTELIWTDYGENGWNPVNRIFGLFLDGFLGPDMEKSIEKIMLNLNCGKDV